MSKKILHFSYLTRYPSLKLTFLISQINNLHLSNQGISLPSHLFDLYFFGYFILCVSWIFFFSQIAHSFSFLLSIFFPHSDRNHQYNWVGILKRITDIIGLESESIFQWLASILIISRCFCICSLFFLFFFLCLILLDRKRIFDSLKMVRKKKVLNNINCIRIIRVF